MSLKALRMGKGPSYRVSLVNLRSSPPVLEGPQSQLPVCCPPLLVSSSPLVYALAADQLWTSVESCQQNHGSPPWGLRNQGLGSFALGDGAGPTCVWVSSSCAEGFQTGPVLCVLEMLAQVFMQLQAGIDGSGCAASWSGAAGTALFF